jgi:NADH-quinone oxidoreductase subunit A
MTPLAAYLLLFVAVGVGFIFVHLLAGYFIRPNRPHSEKATIYECGEPTIGSSWVQFDLRFYVVALLFVIFDVEVAFFFPWAEVFGKANALNANAVQTSTAPQGSSFSALGEMLGFGSNSANAQGTKTPPTAAQYNKLAKNVLDLGTPTALMAPSIPKDQPKTEPMRQAMGWMALEKATANGKESTLALARELKEQKTKPIYLLLQTTRPEFFEIMQKLTPEVVKKMEGPAKRFGETLSRIEAEQMQGGKDFVAAYSKYLENPKKTRVRPVPLDTVQVTLNAVPENTSRELRTRSVGEMKAGPQAVSLNVLGQLGDPMTKQPPPFRTFVPEAVDAVRELEDKHHKLLSDEIAVLQKSMVEVLTPLVAGTPLAEHLANFVDRMSWDNWNTLTVLTPEQIEGLANLDQYLLKALDDRIIQETQDTSKSLAWMALGEIIVFFGVLLVGFVYLWKRGDLEWVRTTSEHGTPTQPQPALAVAQPSPTSAQGNAPGNS